jgi:hypothetical protein
MKKSFLVLLSFVMMVLFGNMAFSQANFGTTQYMNQKAQTPIPAQVTPVEPIPAMTPSTVGNSPTVGLLIPLDGSFTQLTDMSAPWDDNSYGPYTLPWNFCFYGTVETAYYINNNGNVTFGGPTGTFSPSGFPTTGYQMLAPFWGDVVTGTYNGSFGTVYYKQTTNPNRVVVIWDHVGYYVGNNLLNTFELIFTDGNDPLIGIGKNVAFSYADMQWTTGDASGGSGGFGGVPATVGVNHGDGIKYALVGRFDHAGSDYDGPGGGNDGVSYLDDKLFIFDACQETIIIPTGVPISDWALVILGVALLAVGTIYILRRS